MKPRGLMFGLTSLLLAGCSVSPLIWLGELMSRGDSPLQTDAYVEEIASDLPPSSMVSVSPDGSRLAYNVPAPEGQAAPIFVKEGKGAARSVGGAHPTRIWWLPDGHSLAYNRRASSGTGPSPTYSVFVIDLNSGAERLILDAMTEFQPWLAWSPDGKAVLYCELPDPTSTQRYAASLLSLVDGQRTRQLFETSPVGPIDQPVFWQPDGKSLVYMAPAPGFTNARNLMTYDLATSTARFVRRVAADDLRPVLSADGSALAFFQTDYPRQAQGGWEEHVVRLASGSEEVTPFTLGPSTTTPLDNGVTEIAGYFPQLISPNLKWCVIEKPREPLYARELATGRHLLLTSGHANPVAWTPDSKTLIVYTNKGTSHYYRVKVER